jgi:hypothetical protein
MAVDCDDTAFDNEVCRPREARDGLFIVQWNVIVMGLPTYSAVHRAGVDVSIPERLRDGARHRAFASPRRPIDGDDQSLHPNLSRIARGLRSLAAVTAGTRGTETRLPGHAGEARASLDVLGTP